MSVLRFRRDRRQRDPFTAAPVSQPPRPPACRACSPMDYGRCACPQDCGWMSCMGGRREEPHGIATPETLAALVARAEAHQGPWSGASEIGMMPAPVPIADDYRELRVFPAVVRGACRVGLTGLGTRGVHPVPPLPDMGLDRFTADAGDDDFGPEFDQVAERAEAGFYEARRVFHSADTAGFPAVAS